MASGDDWIKAFGSSSLDPNSSPSASSPGITVISGVSSVSGEYGGVAKRANLFFNHSAVCLCFGFVGSGGKRFCLKPLQEGLTTCGISKHSSKFKPDDLTYYLKGTESTAFCAPSLPQAWVPEEYQEAILTTSKTVHEWTEIFSTYENLALASGRLSDTKGTPQVNSLKVLLKTPRKGGTTADIQLEKTVTVPFELDEMVEQATTLPEGMHWWEDDEDESLLPNSLFAFLRALRGFVMKYDQWLVEPHDIAANRINVVEEDLYQLKAYCEGLSLKLGRPVSIQGTDFPDVWCALEFLSNQEHSASTISVQEFQQFGDQLRTIQGVCEKFEPVTKTLMRLETICATHESRFTFIHPMLLSVKRMEADLKETIRRLDELQKFKLVARTTSSPMNSDPWTQNFAPLPTANPYQNDSQFTVPEGDARIRTLEHAVKSLEKRVTGEGTKVGRFLFQSKEDLRLWIAANVPTHRFGLFLDGVSIFDFLAQPHLDTQENMSHLYNSQKNGFETTYESRIISSMQNLFPNLFGKAAADGMDTSQALPGLLSVDKWNNNGVTGLQLQVERELPNVDIQFRNAIASTFEDAPEARDLALELLYRSKKFALDLCHFIQRDYDFWKHKGYTKKEAWELTCLSVRRIFEDIHIVRVVGRDSRDIKQPQLTATQVLWATIRTHTVMDEYTRRNFFEHPSISAVIARHLASHHVRPDDAIEDRVKKLETIITKLNSKMDSLESRLARLESAKNDNTPRKGRGGGRKTKGQGQGWQQGGIGNRGVPLIPPLAVSASVKDDSSSLSANKAPSLFPVPPVVDRASSLLTPHLSLHQGTIPFTPAHQRPTCCVVAEGWPAWLAVLPTLQFSVSKAFSMDPRYTPSVASILPWPLQSEVVPARVSYIFVTGTWHFVSHVWTLWAHTHVIIAALDLGSNPPPGTSGSWFLLQHCHYDGVTSGGWWCGLSCPNLPPPPPLSSHRRLHHLLSDLEPGQPAPAPPLPDPSVPAVHWVGQFVHPGGLMPIFKLSAQCISPSVFKGWVARHLSFSELKRCLDVSVDFDSIFPCLTPDQYLQAPFARTVPGKVLLAIGKSIPLSTEGARDRYSNPCGQTLSVQSQPVSEVKVTNISCELQINTSLPEIKIAGRQKAAKDDDAAVPYEQWDIPFWTGFLKLGRSVHFCSRAASAFCGQSKQSILQVLRSWVLRLWRRMVLRSFTKFMRTKHGRLWYGSLTPDLAAGRDCLGRVAQADFWDWHGGLRLFFWRWPPELQEWARDGHPIYVTGELPSYRKVQPAEPDAHLRLKVKQKLEKFVERGYLKSGSVDSLISYFTVPKGESDVRLVFDGTKARLNEVIWAPSFHLPTIDSLLSLLEPGTWQGDIDVAEQFYNFILDTKIQPFCGVDADPYLRADPSDPRLAWLRWERCVMGLRSSPHGCVKMQALAEETVRGDMTVTSNPFFFDKVRLNLPGDPAYNPSLPRVSKLRSDTGVIAGDMATYVDDVRTTGSSKEHCREVSHRISTRFCYLGIQDALRKRSDPSQFAGAWTGSIAHTANGSVVVMCTQEKWDKARSHVHDIQQQLLTGGTFDYKRLEAQRGFLVYVARTYPSLVPYLKGIHLTLDSWRPFRDSEGWKDQVQVEAHFDVSTAARAHPALVQAVPRLTQDVQGLLTLLQFPVPPTRTVRSSTVSMVLYGFSDASSSGFGTTFQSPAGLTYRYGVWGDDLAGLSSNYRETFNLVDAASTVVEQLKFSHLQHLVQTVEGDAAAGLLLHSELFLFTDNAVAEGAFYRGTSSNKRLFDLVLRLKQLELEYSFCLHVIHVSGHRMQAQGTDALSRGDITTGVMRGTDMLSFIPLHLSACERSSNIVSWCLSWLPKSCTLIPLKPVDWFTKGHGIIGGQPNADGIWIPTILDPSSTVLLWSPAPAAADVAIEQLSYARHKRPELLHIFLCPRLMTHLWRKRLFKVADLVFTLPAGHRSSVWPFVMYEPLVVGVVLPFSPSPPWSRRNTSSILDVERKLRGVWSSPQGDERIVLRELWGTPGGVDL